MRVAAIADQAELQFDGRLPRVNFGRVSSRAIAVGLLTVLGMACASHPPVSKLVNGRIVVSRAVGPEAYEHAVRAQLYEEEQRWADAISELQRALNFDREAVELRAHLADLLLRVDRIDDAAEQVAESLKDEATVPGYLALAHVAQARRNAKGALDAFRSAVDLARADGDPEAIEQTHLALADAQIVALDVEGAHQTVAHLRDLSPESIRARLQLAALAWALGKMPEAESALNEALAIEPSEIDARLMLQALYVATGRVSEAKAAFRQTLNRAEDSLPFSEMFLKWLFARGDRVEAADEADRLTPDTVDDVTVETIVRLERASGRPQRALAATDAALKRGVSPARVALLAAGAWADQKNFEAAARALLQVGRDSPEYIDSRLRAAEVLRELGTPDGFNRATAALNDVDDALKRPQKASDKGDAASADAADLREREGKELVIARALLAEKRGDAIEAARVLDAELKDDPQDPRFLLVRAAIEERRGDWQRALKFAEQVLQIDPRNVEALNFYGFTAVDHAYELPTNTLRLQIAVTLDPGAGGIVDSLGWAYLKANDVVHAAQVLTQAERLEPGDPEILSHLGELYVKQKDVARAVVTFRDVLTRSPPERLARQIEARLRVLGAKQAAGR